MSEGLLNKVVPLWRHRLHQATFCEHMLHAYRETLALDAARRCLGETAALTI